MAVVAQLTVTVYLVSAVPPVTLHCTALPIATETPLIVSAALLTAILANVKPLGVADTVGVPVKVSPLTSLLSRLIAQLSTSLAVFVLNCRAVLLPVSGMV